MHQSMTDRDIGQPPPPIHLLRDVKSPPYDDAAKPRMAYLNTEAMDHARSLGMVALGLYCDLERRCNADGMCWPTLATIAEDFGCSVRHVRDALSKLCAAGLVESKPRFGPTGLQLGNAYFLPRHKCTEKPHDSRAEPTPEPTPEPSCARQREEVVVKYNDMRFPDDGTAEEPKPTTPVYADAFLAFWSVYPKGRGSKKNTYDLWLKLKPDARLVAEIMAGLAAWKQGERWQKAFIMDAERWVRGRFWENPPDPVPTPSMDAAPGNGHNPIPYFGSEGRKRFEAELAAKGERS